MKPATLIVERNVEAIMRDGTILRANVYRPDVAERLPVLLQRTPYGKDGSSVDFCLLSAERGYAAVVQDTRGRWASDGEHYPMRDEFEDGYDTVEWVASQPWANGKVGTWGGSYVGYTQWAAAVTQPPSLKAIFPWVTWADTYTVPTHGGGLCCWQAALPPGAFDQRQIERRDDVLVYTSNMLDEDMEVIGPVKVALWAASDAVDTDFTAKLVDVYPCGYARNVLDGILRARYRHSTKQPQLLMPGAIEEYSIDLGATSNVFLKGHRLRVEISSSNFPRFDRNANTGHAIASEAEMRKASQTIYHDDQHPSHILLPIIPQ